MRGGGVKMAARGWLREFSRLGHRNQAMMHVVLPETTPGEKLLLMAASSRWMAEMARADTAVAGE